MQNIRENGWPKVGVYEASVIYIKYYTTHSQSDLDPRKKMQQSGQKSKSILLLLRVAISGFISMIGQKIEAIFFFDLQCQLHACWLEYELREGWNSLLTRNKFTPLCK